MFGRSRRRRLEQVAQDSCENECGTPQEELLRHIAVAAVSAANKEVRGRYPHDPAVEARFANVRQVGRKAFVTFTTGTVIMLGTNQHHSIEGQQAEIVAYDAIDRAAVSTPYDNTDGFGLLNSFAEASGQPAQATPEQDAPQVGALPILHFFSDATTAPQAPSVAQAAPAIERAPTPETSTGNVVYFKQSDPRWRSSPYHGSGGRGGIGMNGCGPTSLAMVISSLSEHKVSPVDMANYNMAHDYVTSDGATKHSSLDEAPKNFGLLTHRIGLDFNAIAEIVNRNGLVIINGTDNNGENPNTPATKDGHIFVVRGVTPDGKFFIADPASEANSKKAWEPGAVLGPASVAVAVEAPGGKAPAPQPAPASELPPPVTIVPVILPVLASDAPAAANASIEASQSSPGRLDLTFAQVSQSNETSDHSVLGFSDFANGSTAQPSPEVASPAPAPPEQHQEQQPQPSGNFPPGTVALLNQSRPAIDRLQPIYEKVAREEGIPWQMLPAVHRREKADVSDKVSTLAGEPLGTPNPDHPGLIVKTFEGGLHLSANYLKAGARYYGLTLKPDGNSQDTIVAAFVGYNRGSLYLKAGVSPYESPYVMNGFDEQHMNMKWNPPNADPHRSGQDGDKIGAYTVYRMLGGEVK